MATFFANPDEENEPWIEKAAIKINGHGIRNWHIMFFCFSSLVTIVVLLCCCIKFRIPRTKQEIESDYRRKKLAQKFQERLRLIHNQDMDELDLQQALKLIQEDFDQENARIAQSMALESPLMENIELGQQEIGQRPKFAKKFADIMLASSNIHPQSMGTPN